MPNVPATPVRTYRASDELYEAVQRAAADNGDTVTDIIIRAFERYIRDHPPVQGIEEIY